MIKGIRVPKIADLPESTVRTAPWMVLEGKKDLSHLLAYQGEDSFDTDPVETLGHLLAKKHEMVEITEALIPPFGEAMLPYVRRGAELCGIEAEVSGLTTASEQSLAHHVSSVLLRRLDFIKNEIECCRDLIESGKPSTPIELMLRRVDQDLLDNEEKLQWYMDLQVETIAGKQTKALSIVFLEDEIVRIKDMKITLEKALRLANDF